MAVKEIPTKPAKPQRSNVKVQSHTSSELTKFNKNPNKIVIENVNPNQAPGGNNTPLPPTMKK